MFSLKFSWQVPRFGGSKLGLGSWTLQKDLWSKGVTILGIGGSLDGLSSTHGDDTYVLMKLILVDSSG